MKKPIIIGIRKRRNLFTVGLGIVLFFAVTFFICMWATYNLDFAYQSLKDYGTEVEAEIVSVFTDSDPNSTAASNYRYILQYEYVSEDGTVYRGDAAVYSNKKLAEEQIGKKIIITIEPDGFSSWVRQKDIRDQKFTLHLILLIISVIVLLFVLYLFFYRGFYRDRLNHKLVFNGSTVATGEVIKTWGLLLKRVKVLYTDLDGKVCEAWARHLFKAREARFLADKKFINIRIAKNRYGIDEVMTKD